MKGAISVGDADCGYRKFKAPIPAGFVLPGQHTNLYAVNDGGLNGFHWEIYPQDLSKSNQIRYMLARRLQ